MVYYVHATTPVIFGALMVIYYFSIPLALIFWYARSRAYIKKDDYKLGRLAAYLLISLVLTSYASYKMTLIYLSIHSPSDGAFCMTSSCVLSSDPITYYHVNTTDLERLGLPSLGPMMVYRVYDKGLNATGGLPVRMNYVAVVRPLVILPGTEVNVYYLKGTTAESRERFFIFWPLSPGGVLTKKLGTVFTVIIVTGGNGPGA